MGLVWAMALQTSATVLLIIHLLFFFQAEDGIRDRTVTGVQTCALPICYLPVVPVGEVGEPVHDHHVVQVASGPGLLGLPARRLPRVSRVAQVDDAQRSRSEERRVGKECRTRGSRHHY